MPAWLRAKEKASESRCLVEVFSAACEADAFRASRDSMMRGPAMCAGPETAFFAGDEYMNGRECRIRLDNNRILTA